MPSPPQSHPPQPLIPRDLRRPIRQMVEIARRRARSREAIGAGFAEGAVAVEEGWDVGFLGGWDGGGRERRIGEEFA